MNYDKGNVIEKRGIIFKDNFTPDPKESHPVMITIAVSEDNCYMYYLTLTSQVNKYYNTEHMEHYFLVKKTSYNMLKKTSLVNLVSIYREKVAEYRPVGFIQSYEYDKLIRKFKEYQECNPDEFYEEIKHLI